MAGAPPEAARIRWLCRRGMKELDVLLERFYLAEFAHLDAASRQAFHQLLSYEDPDLYAILVGGVAPGQAQQDALAIRIRDQRPV